MNARWDIEPLQRLRRGFDERVLLAAPWLMRVAFSLVRRARPGSRLRRFTFGHLLRVGIAANNRGDYDVLSAGLSREVELHVLPDAPEVRAVDMASSYHGREGYVRASEVWKAGFAEFRWELR